MRGADKYKTSEWVRQCPTCRGIVYHKNEASLRVGLWKNCPCWECRSKVDSAMKKGIKRPPFTADWRRNIGRGHKKSNTWKASMNTLEYKEKHRQKMLRMIRDGKSKVAFNSRACKVFDFINLKMGWHGQHALHGGEITVNLFFLDFYDPSSNVAIEWDEKHHRKPSRHRADWIKQHVIMDSLKCEFYRIDEESKIVRKIDNCSSDRTADLQNLIKEYYKLCPTQ